MYTTSDFKRGLRIEFEGQPYTMTEFQHHKPGKGAAVTRTKLKNLITGSVIDPTFRSGDKVKEPDLDQQDYQYLYKTEDVYHFMEPITFEQVEINEDVLGDATKYLTDSLVVELLFWNEKAISIELPNHVVLEVTDCDPAVKGDTVTGASKPAVLSTGHKVYVPLFINQGDKLKVDTRTGDYLERA
ncbi:MAG: elongation factor P [Deltaproteobacteria bacterium]|nr:elongation factor P [Deltaproteobacteria bacterium]